MTTAVFEIEVDIDPMLVEEDPNYDAEDPDDMTDEEIEDFAREIMYSAPGFDFVGDYMLDELRLARIERDNAEMTHSEVYAIFEDFGEQLEAMGFDVSVGSTGGTSLEKYAEVQSADVDFDFPYQINISTNINE